MMSTEAFPVLFLNMSGEMIYIVEQRLTAQSIEVSKSERVINEILLAMFSPNLINDVLRKQTLPSFNILRDMFETLAHSSIMKLNEQSMNKLFDLMVMVTKYQIVCTNRPIDLIQITLNHLESMSRMAQTETLKLIELSKQKFMFSFANMDQAHLQTIRYTILTFLQDIKTRVSIFLRDGTQENDGKFVIKPDGIVFCQCQIPGSIKYFNQSDVIEVDTFPSSGHYVVSLEKTTLGFNIYSRENSQKDVSDEHSTEGEQSVNKQNNVSEEILTKESVKNELNLLAKLIGRDNTEPNNIEIEFYLNLGTDEINSEKLIEKQTYISNELKLNEGIHKNRSLENIINELNCDDLQQNNDFSNDLLALMDS